MLSNDEFEDYLRPLGTDQVASIRAVRALILEISPHLTEAIDSGKWFSGLLTYTAPGGVFAYALGPRSGGFTTLHMMPYYASPTLQQRHGGALKKLLSGKSCIRFKHFSDIPEGVLSDIFISGPAALEEAVKARAERAASAGRTSRSERGSGPKHTG